MITIRPNLNNDKITVHAGRLGKVIKYVDEIMIDCTCYVVRKAGNKQLKQGKHKTVHAGLCGDEITYFDKPSIASTAEIKYNVKKACFTVDGYDFTGGLVYMINQRAYLIQR